MRKVSSHDLEEVLISASRLFSPFCGGGAQDFEADVGTLRIHSIESAMIKL
jgi:hypothetical protein